MSDITDILDRDSVAVLRAFWRRVQPVLRMTGCLNEKELPAKMPVQLTANMRTALCALKFDDIEARLAAAEADATAERDELATLATLLPGTLYLDPPDGGSVTIFEQFQRMALDAEKYRALQATAQEDK